MEEKYSKAPDIITGKDLDYLKDMFGWHYTAYKLMINSLDFLEDKSVYEMIQECSKVFLEHMHLIIKLVKDGANEK